MAELPTKAPSREQGEAEAKEFLRRGQYASGGRLKQEEKDPAARDTRKIKSAVSQHENHDHPGKPHTSLKLKHGGKVKGEKPGKRMDKRARGGGLPMPEKESGGGAKKASGHKGGKAPVNVNIISPGAAEGEKKQAAAAGLQAGAKIGAAQAMRGGAGGPPPGAGGPPVAGGPPGAGGPPAAMPPPGAQPPMKRGGRTERRAGGKCD